MNIITPSGFRDILPDEASERESIVRKSQDLFAQHGFLPIETPTLEVMDVIRAGRKVATAPFKFFDSKGDLLAMRPDVTLQVARMCATRIGDRDGVHRFRYTQRVFRDDTNNKENSAREITQIGVECIGDTGFQVDLEIIELLVSSLGLAGVGDVSLSLASVGPLRALLDRSGANDEWKAQVLNAYHTSDFVELKRLTSDRSDALFENIAPAYADAIYKLSEIRGGKEAIERARGLVSPLGCNVGLDELARIYGKLEADGSCRRVLIDFSVISSFDYYTGIVFEAYSPYLGVPIGSGGRYDNMISAYGKDLPAAGFAFCLEQAMAAITEENERGVAEGGEAESDKSPRKLRIAVPKGALNKDAISCMKECGYDTERLENAGRALVIETEKADFYIVRPSDAPAFVAFGAADCGICGRDSLLESGANVVELVDLKFGKCKFVVAAPRGFEKRINERYRRLGSIRVATKYPNITLEHFAKTGTQVDIVKLNGNIELAPLTGMAEEIVDITATGTTLKENDLVIMEDVLDSTARFFANPCSFRTNDEVVRLARALSENASGITYEPIAGKPM